MAARGGSIDVGAQLLEWVVFRAAVVSASNASTISVVVATKAASAVTPADEHSTTKAV